MPSSTFYTVLVESVENKKDSFIQVFFTWADDIGSAIVKVVTVARDKEGIADPIPSELDPYDIDTLPDEVEPIGDTGVMTSGKRFYYPTEDVMFRVPTGVILSPMDGEYDPEELHEGYTMYEDGELFCLDAVLTEDSLLPVYIRLVTVLPSIRVSWVELSDEWEDVGKKQFYANEAMNTVKGITDFLQGDALNILQNGFVKFTVYCEEGATNLVINDHKGIDVMTHNEEIRTALRDALDEFGVGESAELKSLSQGLYHWHYKPQEALGRRALITWLEADGFFLWKEIDPEADAEDEDESQDA